MEDSMTPDEARNSRMQDYLICFSTEAGKRVLLDMEKSYSKSCFDTDPLMMAYREGRRDVVLSIRYIMEQALLNLKSGKQKRAEV